LLLRERVAIKVLFGADTEEMVIRFMAEARAAARVQSEHIARVFDVGQIENGPPYMVLEYLEGRDLATLIEAKGPLPIGEAADYLLEALEGVGQAHALGIIHRDLKPSNLFLAERNDGSSVIKVLDFGIAKNLSTPTLAEQKVTTSSRALLGSPHYMSPEQIRLPKSVDARSDIWSLGVVLHKLLTATVPFDGETLGELFAKILETAPLPVSAHRPDLPRDIVAIVSRCLARDPNERYTSVLEVAEALAPFASPDQRVLVNRMRRSANAPRVAIGPPSAEGPTISVADPTLAVSTAQSWTATHARSDPRFRRWRLPLALGGLGALGALALAGIVAFRVGPTPHSPLATTGATTGDPNAAPITAVALPTPSPVAPQTGPAPVVSANPPTTDPPPVVSVARPAAPSPRHSTKRPSGEPSKTSPRPPSSGDLYDQP
jgi:serine/threonine-protein kinase